jgi:hypothetical protein
MIVGFEWVWLALDFPGRVLGGFEERQCIFQQVADFGVVYPPEVRQVHVEGDRAEFGPGMDGQVGFSQADYAGKAASLEIVEYLPYRLQTVPPDQVGE